MVFYRPPRTSLGRAAILAVLLTTPLATAVADPSADGGWLDAVERRLAAEEYHLTWQDRTVLPGLEAAYQAPNRGQGLRTYFTAAGIRVVPRAAGPETLASWEWSLSLVGYGTGGQSWRVPQAELAAADNRMEYLRGALAEWYVNEPRGLKQGFTLPAPPDELALRETLAALGVTAAPGRGREGAHASGSLVHLDLELSGDLRPVIATDGRSIDFLTGSGARAVRYDGLVVTDATGRMLDAWMEGVAGEPVRGIRLVFDARDAAWPVTVDPLATSPAWAVDSNQQDASLGYSVATAGDVNGDGYSDVIVGAPGEVSGGLPGAAYLYLGGASGPAASPSWTAAGEAANNYFGWSVATAGDVNGDGYSDVIVGAWGHAANTGKAYLYLGGPGGLATSPSWTAEGEAGSGSFGYAVATAGDVNADGRSDVIVGAWSLNGQAGKAYLYLGGASGPAATPSWTAEGLSSGERFALSVATAGDVNGDGYADVIVGAYLYDDEETDEGRALVYYGNGSNEGLSLSPAWMAEGDQPNAGFGWSVATAGDVNGDGYADVIVGADGYDNGQTDEGRAFVYLGSSSGPAASPAWTAEGDQGGARFGSSVSTAGDVNGDGYPDVIVGAHSFTNGETDEGRAYVYHGSASGLATSAAWTKDGGQAVAAFGLSVSTAGDVNGDGSSDVIVGASGYDNGQTDEGRAFVWLGSASGLETAAAWAAESDQAGAGFGASVSTAGDVNGDGYSDVIVGAPGYDNGHTDEGRAFVWLGSASGLATTAAWTAESDRANAWFGWSVATAGDVNGDGYSDVIVGAPYYDDDQNNEGRAYVYLGSASGLETTAAWTAESDQVNPWFGYSVATAGDVNGDGYSDVIVGAPMYTRGLTQAGGAFVFPGSASGLEPLPAWEALSDQEFTRFGWSVATAGDVNGDGYSDVIIGAPYYNNGDTDEGRAYVYLGSVSGLATPAAWTKDGNERLVDFGTSVSTAGDVNGDGYSDVIIGAPYYNDGGSGWGRAFVWLGSASGLGTTAAWAKFGGQDEARFALTVATAGDVNGDGYSDVIVGAPSYDNGDSDEGRAFVWLGSASGLETTVAWAAESDQADAQFGWSVATAGDVNGDGYSDVIVGAPYYDNGQTDQGRGYVHLGNAAGLSVAPQQRRVDDLAPIAPGLWSDTSASFRLAALGRTPLGRGRVRLRWEVKPLGTSFDGTGTGQSASWSDTGVGGVALNEAVSGLSLGTSYHWRVRLLHDPVTSPFLGAGRWLAGSWNGWQEADLRTSSFGADVSVTQVDLADPVTHTQTITYRLTVANAGPAGASVVVSDVLPAGASFVAATPMQGSCNEAGGTVTCDLGFIGAGGSAIVDVEVAPGVIGGYMNQVAASGSYVDPNPTNDTSIEETTVVVASLGGRVWNDGDGDGVQGSGEPSVEGVVVELLDHDTGLMVNLEVTASDGAYGFEVSATAYRLRFHAPAGWALTVPDMGGDDALDSDAGETTGETVVIGPVFTPEDATRWDAGLHCIVPDEEVFIHNVRLSTDGNDYTILDFQDSNTAEVTGFNVYISPEAGLDPALWTRVASNVTDMDGATPHKQWIDQSNDVSPSGIWYYKIAPYNTVCDAEGPW